MDTVIEGWNLTLGLRQGPRGVASSDHDTSPTGIDIAAEPDETLMQRYRRGNELAFQELYRRYRGPLLRFVRKMSPGAAEDEDIAQEVWIAVIRGRERYVPRARFVTYLFSIAHRKAVDRWRRLGRSLESDLSAEEPESVAGPARFEPDTRASNMALRADLLSAVAALPILQREAFLLRAEGGLTVEEIAAVTDSKRETAKSRLRFALSRLRVTLERWA